MHIVDDEQRSDRRATPMRLGRFADLFLGLDFRNELTDVHKGPWELLSPRRLKPRRGPNPLRGTLST